MSTEGKQTAGQKRIGELFVESGILSEADLSKGLDYSKKAGMPLGKVLVMLRLASDADLRAVLHVQSLMKFENMPGNLAVKALEFMKENRVHIEWACKQVGWESEKFRNAVPPRLRALKDRLAAAEQQHGPDHPEVADALFALAEFYEDEGMWAHAEAQCQMALEHLEKNRSDNQLKIAIAHWIMGNLLFLQDRFEEAQTHYEESLSIKRNTLGAEHIEVAKALHDVAEVLDIQKKYADAEKYYDQSLSVREKSGDIDVQEPDVLECVRRLSFVCARRGRPADHILVGKLLTDAGIVAEEKIPEALAYGKEKGVPMARALVMLSYLSEEQLRPVLHAQLLIKSSLLPAPLATRILRLCSTKQMPFDEAMLLCGWKLQTSRSHNLSALLQTNDELIEAEKSLPPDHPDIAALCLQLADMYESYERYADAEPLYKRAFSILEKLEDHRHEAMSVSDKLGWVFVQQAKYDLAEEVYRQVLELRTNAAEPDHSDISRSHQNLGRLYVHKTDYGQASIQFEKALPLAERHFGPQDQQVGHIAEQLALCYYETADYDKAEPYFWKAFNINKHYYDIQSFEITGLLAKLADLYNKQGKYSMADSVIGMFQQKESAKSVLI